MTHDFCVTICTVNIRNLDLYVWEIYNLSYWTLYVHKTRLRYYLYCHYLRLCSVNPVCVTSVLKLSTHVNVDFFLIIYITFAVIVWWCFRVAIFCWKVAAGIPFHSGSTPISRSLRAWRSRKSSFSTDSIWGFCCRAFSKLHTLLPSYHYIYIAYAPGESHSLFLRIHILFNPSACTIFLLF